MLDFFSFGAHNEVVTFQANGKERSGYFVSNKYKSMDGKYVTIRQFDDSYRSFKIEDTAGPAYWGV
jgi:hypothetical protein